MLVKDRISKIVNLVSDLSEKHDDLIGLGEITINGIKASEGRAVLQEPRLSVAARFSVCSGAMHFASVANDKLDFEPCIKDLLEEIMAIAPMIKADHNAFDDVLAPFGYSGPAKGPFNRRLDKASFTIVRKPNLPGGNWTLLINGIPSVYGSDPDEVAEKSQKLEHYFEAKLELTA